MRKTSDFGKFNVFTFLSIAVLILIISLPSSLVSAGSSTPPEKPNRPPLQERYGDLSALPLEPLPEEGQVLQQPENLLVQPSRLANCSLSEPDPEAFRRVVFQAYVNNSNWDVGLLSDCMTSTTANITNHPANDVYPRLRPGGDRFTFASNRTGNFEIYTAAVDGSNVTQLTNHAALDTQPSWSPDGKQIVFVSERSGDAELYILNIGNGKLVQLTSLPGIDMTPDWSPDGSKIAWVQASNGYGRIVMINLTTSVPQVVTSWLPYLSTPMWSPDGSRLAFEYDGDNDGWIELGVVNADGTNLFMPANQDNKENDKAMGSWSVSDRYLFFSTTNYIAYEGEWYILNAGIWRLELNVSSLPVEFSPADNLWKYSFYPQVQSLDNTVPETSITQLPEFSPALGFMIHWQGQDTGLGDIVWAGLQKRIGLIGDWLYIGGFRGNYTTNSSVPKFYAATEVSGQPGETLYFRTSSQDLAGHSEPWAPSEQGIFTRLYRWVIDGIMVDVRGNPLGEVDVWCEPGCMNEPVSGKDGHALSYTSSDAAVQMAAEVPGFTGQPGMPLDVSHNTQYTRVLAAGQNVIKNPGFEVLQPPLQDWQIAGSLPAALAQGHSVEHAAVLGNVCTSPCLSDPELITPTYSPFAKAVVDKEGVVYSLNAGLFSERSLDGVWSAPVSIFALEGISYAWYDLAVDSNQTVHVVMTGMDWALEKNQFYYRFRQKNSSWSDIEVIGDMPPSFFLKADGIGNLYLFTGWSYRVRNAAGEWSGPTSLPAGPIYDQVAFDASGQMHFVITKYVNGTNKVFYYRTVGNGVLISEEIQNFLGSANALQESIIAVTSDDRVHVLFRDNLRNYYTIREPQGGWRLAELLPVSDKLLHLIGDNQDGLHLLVSDNNQYQYYHKLASNDSFELSFNLPETMYEPGIFVDQRRQLHFFTWPQFLLTYFHSQLASSSEMVTISQEFLVPEVNQPTLSLVYRLDGQVGPGAEASGVLFAEGATVGEPIFASSEASGWQHAWLDLTPWIGQTVRLDLTYQQAAGEPISYLLADDVTVGAWNTPLLNSVSPRQTYWVPGEPGVNVTLTGENFLPGANVLVDGLALDSGVTWVDAQHIQAELTASGYTVLSLQVENPGGIRSLALPVTFGQQVFIPLIQN